MAQPNPLNPIKRIGNPRSLNNEALSGISRDYKKTLNQYVMASSFPFSIGSDLSLFIGKPGSRYDELFLQMALAASEAGQKVLFVSLAFPPDEIERQLASAQMGLPFVLDRDEPSSAKKSDNITIIGRDNQNSKERINANWVKKQLHQLNASADNKAPIDLVFIDSLFLMKANDSQASNSQMAEQAVIMREFHKLMQKTNVGIKIAQPALSSAVRPGVPFAHKGACEYYDYVYHVHRPENNVELTPADRALCEGQVKVALAQNRHGALGSYDLKIDREGRIWPEK